MSLKEIIVDIIIPLISGFVGGSIGSIIIVKNKFTVIGSINKDKRKINNKKAIYQNVGEIYNGDKNR
ncbi:MAG: hypothetical protein J6A15_08525 [Clostridia bacterium]|nr:hypothetical protein [Clostridia bacterium]